MDDGNKEVTQQDQVPVNENAMELSAAFSHAINESDDAVKAQEHESQVDAGQVELTDQELAGLTSEPEQVKNPNNAPLPDHAETGKDSGEGDDSCRVVEVDLFGDVIDEDDDDNELDDNDIPEQEITTCSVVEAILFAADEPINVRKIAEIINAGGIKEVKKHIRELNRRYKKMGCAFRVEELAGGYQLLTQSAYNPWLSKLIKVRSEGKLSAAAMETLAIIAYKQPLMRVEIENIRGVAAGEMIRQLIEKGLVKITGRAEELGRPLLYGTTQKFLDIFGLASLKDLPQPEAAPKAK